MSSLADARRAYAERVRSLASLRSEALVRAFATVPRETFVGPGPWQLIQPGEPAPGYVTTPDADPRRLYDNVLVALDAERWLNNGEPAALARWLDALDLEPGERFLHVGCGVGYYTAIAAEALGPSGRVVGVEIDGALAARARRNLASYPGASVVASDAEALGESRFDVIFVNAGATEIPPRWLDGLARDGRLLVPLTVDAPGHPIGVGHMLLVVQGRSGASTRFVSPVGIYPCAGARTPAGEARLALAYRRGGQGDVRSLRRDEHAAEDACWLHTPSFCLSAAGAPGPHGAR